MQISLIILSVPTVPVDLLNLLKPQAQMRTDFLTSLTLLVVLKVQPKMRMNPRMS